MLFAGLLVLLLGLLPKGARAFDDAPLRAARLAYSHGDVTVLNSDYPGGSAAQLNMPLTEGVRLETGENGEAEVEFEDGSLIRLTPRSSVLLFRLGASSDGHYGTELVLSNGLVYAELRATTKYAYRIDAGRDVVTPVANATIRIMLDQPPARIAVLDGTAHVERMGSQADTGFEVDVEKGESLRGDAAAGARYFLTQQIDDNSWDTWNEEREQSAANASAARTSARNRYAGDQGYGWSDLDANGTWYDTGQGPVWQPFDASVSGFDPYGYGSWVWYPGPGYVWSSGYVWGWTPFRCGNWNYWPDFGWGWVPSSGYAWGGGFRGNGGVGINRRGNTINLSNVPPGYQRPLPPVPGGPVRVHPILPVRSGPAPKGERLQTFEPRKIAGQTAMPLRSVEGGYTPRGGSAVGSSLRRDFPVDRVTRQPMLGAITAPTGRRAVEAGSRPTPSAVGADSGVTAFPSGSLWSAGERRTGERGPGERGMDGVRAERGQGQGIGRTGVTTMPGAGAAQAGEAGRPAYPSRNVVAPPASSSVAAPPPQPVRVHPIDRPGERVQPGPVNRIPQPTGIQRTEPMPSMRSVPAPPPPMRSAPASPAPVPMRSSPPSAPAGAPSPAASTTANPRK